MKYSIVLLFVFVFTFSLNAQEKCVQLKIEIDDEKFSIDSSFNAFFIHEGDTLQAIVKNNMLCFIVPNAWKSGNFHIKGKGISLFFPNMDFSFLRINDGTDWIIGSDTKPFNLGNYHLKNLKKVKVVDYFEVEAIDSDRVRIFFKKRKNGTYIHE